MLAPTTTNCRSAVIVKLTNEGFLGSAKEQVRGEYYVNLRILRRLVGFYMQNQPKKG